MELSERLIEVKRVTKVVKGGRVLSFTSLVVVGDGESKVGFANCKAKEVPMSMQKAKEKSKKNMIKIHSNQSTILYPVVGRHDSTKVVILPASEGTGVIASAVVRSILEFAGIKNALTKTYGSRNKKNIVRATFKALEQLKTVDEINFLRA